MSKINLDHHTPTRSSGQEHVQQILCFLGASEEDKFFFFSSGADAIEYLYQAHFFDCVRQTGKNHIVTTSVEEDSILLSLKKLEALGCSAKIINVNHQGQLTRESLETAIGPRTSLVSLSWANGLTGVIHPIGDLAECCKERGVRLHVDASYAIGKQYFRFEDLPIDYLTFEKGTAGLVVKAETPFSPPVSSTMGAPVDLLAALAKGLEEEDQMFDYVCLETTRLRDRLEQGIMRGFPEAKVLFQKAERLPNCTAIEFSGVFGEALLFLLNRRGIFAAIQAETSLSFSLSYRTRAEEIERAIEEIVACAQKLKSLSVHI